MPDWLLIFVPVAIALEYLAPEHHLLIFIASAIAILPLASWLGRATEQLADPARGSAASSMRRSAMPPNSSSH